MIRNFIKSLLNLPFSPALFRTCVWLARLAGLLRYSSPPEGHEIRAIFISSPFDRLGDQIFLIPFLEVVHRSWPSARIDVAVGSGIAPFVARIPYLGNVFPCPVITRHGYFAWRVRELRAIISFYEKEISRYSYDLAFAPRWGSDLFAITTRYLAYLTNARRRCGYSATVDGGSPSLDALFTDVAFSCPFEQEALRYAVLPELLGLTASDAHAETIAAAPNETLLEMVRTSDTDLTNLLQEKAGSAIADYAIISPGATNPANLWPSERFAALATDLHSKHGLATLIVGGKSDQPVCDAIAAFAAGPVVSIAGKTSFLELAVILHRAKVFIGNDSGPGHLAAGLGIPTVSISRLPSVSNNETGVSAARFRPSGPNVLLVQPVNYLPPCSGDCTIKAPHCITQISTVEVLTAIERTLSRKTITYV